ncbi:nucleoside phosphatase GDA1/CD39 [Atractiella rhizophila]|nr:nucleoside phosphatase GDA1/CD39 [Atractiella rhizophila]
MMIDAGSTGSRIHVYKFLYCQSPSSTSAPSLKLDNEVFLSLNPGLSSSTFATARDAALSLVPLLEKAKESVPQDEWKCSPISVKATAGLRLLGEREADAILREVEGLIERSYGFPLTGTKEGAPTVEIMDGSDEGVYSWITLNYLSSLIGPASSTSKSHTAGIIDLGGASLQTVFSPHSLDPSLELPPTHIYNLTFSPESYLLYQHSHLGYGLMEARRTIHNLLVHTTLWSSLRTKTPMAWDDLKSDTRIPHPCFYPGSEKKVMLDPKDREKKEVTFYGPEGNKPYEACRRLVNLAVGKDQLCTLPPCSFGGVWQPLMNAHFSGPLWALSYFTDRILPLLHTSASWGTISLGELKSMARDVCEGPKSWGTWLDGAELEEEMRGRPEWCLDLGWMIGLLEVGWELDDTRELLVGKQVDGVELGWSLGATLAMLEGDVKCLV